MSEGEAGTSLPRVVILGGGVAGITTAFELSAPGWRDKFSSITVYQYGWRLGGKGASGRGAHGRIEEHGLHIWLGFYENAFRIMRECYEELGRDATSPIPTINEAFERSSLFIVQEPRGDSWVPWMASFSEADAMPGERHTDLPSLWECLVSALRLAVVFVGDAKAAPAPPGQAVTKGVSLRSTTRFRANPHVFVAPTPRSVAHRLASEVRALWNDVYALAGDATEGLLAAATLIAEQLPANPADHNPADHHRLRDLIERGAERFRRSQAHPDDLPDPARREWYLADILLAAIRGVLHDGVLVHPDGLDLIDGYDFSEWLIRHGAHPEAAHCSMVTTLMYDLPFSYRDGDPTQPANGAGTALRGAIRTLFTYTGAIAWKMRAGMGDIVFAPMWEVLDKRGVRFEFFHRIDALHLSADGRRVASIDVSRQVRLRDPSNGYQPLVDVKGLPCWPNGPLNEQLEHDVTADDVESFWSTSEVAEQYALRDGSDYDIAVLAIPVGAHPFVCKELIEHSPRWEEMVDNIGTIYTQAFQLWLNVGMDELGCDWPQATTGGYYEPFDTYADMRQLIEREDWEPGAVGAIAYFCNVMPTPRGVARRDDHELPMRAADEVKANALSFVRHEMTPLWPRGVRRYPTEFRWELLVDDEERTGPSRFDAQFWRANVDPSERYVLSLPNTSQYRLAPGASGYDNLVLAGDWTKCALNSGCVEAAVISGLLAAAATLKTPPRQNIVGCKGEGGQHVW